MMTDADFEKWRPIVHHVVSRHFFWAYASPGDDTRLFRRHLEYDDLVQEGYLALLDSWGRWQSNHPSSASFKTYAFSAIRRRVWRFVDANISPITTKDWQSARKYDSGVDDKLSSAVACRLFSELRTAYSSDDGNGGVPEIEGDNGLRSTEDVLNNDWTDHCMGLLNKSLGNSELNILMEKARGKTYSQIGKKRGITREMARRRYDEIIVKAAVALLDQEIVDDG